MAKSTGYTKKGSLLSKLDKAIITILVHNLAVKQKEKLLIVCDSGKLNIAKRFFEIASSYVHIVDMVEIPVGNVNGEEPPASVAKKMLNYDVEILITTKSLTHTKARKNACARGVRIATLPNVQEDTLERAINVDYRKMHQRIALICNVLDKGKVVKIISPAGTNLMFSIKGRKAYGRRGGIINEKGKCGNLPSGEAYIAPIEGSAEGVYVIDGSIGGIGQVDEPVKVLVDEGYAIKITGGNAAKKLNKILEKMDKKARNIAEFGIGANEKAVIIGNLLEDEKVMGTCHIALGDNTGFGGKTEVPLHIDGLIKKPTVFVDDKKIMKEGKLIL